MNFDQLGLEWRAVNERAATREQRERLIASTRRRLQQFWRRIVVRDLIETVVGLGVIVYFVWIQFARDLSPLERVGAGVVAASAAYIIYRMNAARRGAPPVEAPLRDYCSTELVRVEKQARMLKTVLAWYLAPLMSGLVLMSFGRHGLDRRFFVDLAVFAVITVVLNALNQRAVRTQILPLRNRLLTLRDELDFDDAADAVDAEIVDSPKGRRPNRRRRWLLLAIAFGAAIVLAALAGKSGYEGAPQSEGPQGAWLAGVVSEQRRESGLVGLAAMVTHDGQLVAAAADGERKHGSGVPVEIGDRWHLGSITKSITATMIARLIESGQMQWSDTVGERFAGAPLHEDWKPVTLRQLLTHTSGAPANFSLWVRLKDPPPGAERMRQRREAVLDVLADQPDYPPGTKFAYSNVGYTIAGAMAEAATGESWEDLVRREVFEPLELAGAGFGPPKSPSDTLDQPRGHTAPLGWKVAAADDADNTPIMGPSGTVHMTLADLCMYAHEHLRGELGEGQLLAGETYQRLHAPERDDYACGWVVKKPTYALPHTTFWHNGSNTMWYALVVFVPAKNLVIAVTANDGDVAGAESAAWKIVHAAAKRFDTERDAAAREKLPSYAFPRQSPFTAVRWHDDRPEVRVGREWFELVSLDGVPADDILQFARETYPAKWHKRFEEDLVELLVRMGHPPQDTVRLVVRPSGSNETRTLSDVPMTEANRRAIRSAAEQ